VNKKIAAARAVGGDMSKRMNPRAEHLRLALAQEAARIMSEQGIDDYRLAKRKAAERLGATDIAVLPKNSEIEAALARIIGCSSPTGTHPCWNQPAGRHCRQCGSCSDLIRGWWDRS